MIKLDRFQFASSIILLYIVVNFSYAISYSIYGKYKTIFWLIPTLAIAISGIMCYFVTIKNGNRTNGGLHAAYFLLFFSIAIDLYQNYPTYRAVEIIFAFILFTISVVIFFGIENSARVVIILATAWSSYIFLQEDYQSIGGDLLPIVIGACKNLLHGIDPYTADYSKITGSAFFYLPVQWIFFLPAAKFNVDPRILNVIIIVIFAIWAGKFGGINNKNIKINSFNLLFMTIVMSPIFTRAGQRTYILPYWLLLMILIWAFIKRKDMISAILCGLLLAMRQNFIFDAFIIFVGMIGNIKSVRLVTYCIISVTIAGLALAPFVIWHPGFFYEIFVHRPSIAIIGNLHNEIASKQVGIVPIFRNFGLNIPIFMPQLIVVFVLFVAFVSKIPKTRFEIAIAAGGMDLLVALFGSQTFEYYWGSGFIIVMGALLAAATEK